MLKSNMADEECPEKPKFRLFFSNNEVFVWDKDTVLTLRRDYRIVGSLIGSLPSKPRQNLLFSLPLVLQAEEVTLLVEKNLASVVTNSSLPPSSDTVKCFQNERQANIDEQIEKFKEIKKEKLAEFAEVIEEGRVKKQTRRPNDSKRKHSDSEEDNKKKRRCSEGSEHDEIGEVCEGISNEKCLPGKHKIVHKKDNPNDNSDTQENYKDSTLIHVSSQHPPSLQTIVEAPWTFPNNERETLRYKVFLDLWEKGYYITQGSKFGGDYLVYPSDPFRFHSYFVVTIIPWKEKISPLELVSVGRLGSSVKKTSVLASVDSSGNVIYTSIQWPGFT